MFLEVLPTLEMIAPEKVKNRTCIVIDVFRATSTIVTAMYNGCAKIIPSDTIEKSWKIARYLSGTGKNDASNGSSRAEKPEQDVLIGGERMGRPIPGFHLGNSPLEYTAEAVKGKKVVMTTTNGTAAINKAAQYSGTVLIGSMLNARAAAYKACTAGKNVTIICAGTLGRLSLEDTLAAGTIINEMLKIRNDIELIFDHALLAYRLALSYGGSPEKGLFDAYNAKRLTAMGKRKDIYWCARLNKYPVVPVHEENGIIVRKRFQ